MKILQGNSRINQNKYTLRQDLNFFGFMEDIFVLLTYSTDEVNTKLFMGLNYSENVNDTKSTGLSYNEVLDDTTSTGISST